MRGDDVALLDALAELAAAVGMKLPPDAVADEHVRWPIYDEATRRPEARPALLRIVRLEPDVSVAESIVALMVEEVDEAEQDQWVQALPAEHQGFARWRAREVGVSRSVAGDGVDPEEVDVDPWSDWLQRRVARDSGRLGVLEALAVHGRTRRVRALATERARQTRRRMPS